MTSSGRRLNGFYSSTSTPRSTTRPTIGRQSAFNRPTTPQNQHHELQSIQAGSRQPFQQQVLTSLEKVVEQQKMLSEKFQALEDKTNILTTMQENHNKGKTLIPKELSGEIKHLHSNAPNQFNGKLGYKEAHNQDVATYLRRQIKGHFRDKFSEAIISRAVYRYYESRRRLVLDERDSRKDIAEKNKAVTKVYNRQKRLFQRRSTVLKGSVESNAWKKLPIKCMSQEESDYDDRNEVTFTVSSPCWRSEVFQAFIKKLDRRLEKLPKSRGNGLVKRVPGPTNPSEPPRGTPDWAISRTWQNGDEELEIQRESLPVSEVVPSPSVNITAVTEQDDGIEDNSDSSMDELLGECY